MFLFKEMKLLKTQAFLKNPEQGFPKNSEDKYLKKAMLDPFGFNLEE
jgi:hypothetical protein